MAPRRRPARPVAETHPDLVGELDVDAKAGVDLAVVGARSGPRLWWRCPEGHRWEARVIDRSEGRAVPCPPAATPPPWRSPTRRRSPVRPRPEPGRRPGRADRRVGMAGGVGA